MRIAQLSDLHFARFSKNPLQWFSKRFFGQLNWLFSRRQHFGKELLIPLPALFQKLGVDLVLLGGDFTTTSLLNEYEEARQFASSLKNPWLSIPGNHDHYTYRSKRQNHFYRYFTNPPPQNSPFGAMSLKEHGIEVHSIAPNWWVVALDTCIATPPHSSQGLFSASLEGRLEAVLQQMPQNASVILFNHYPFFQNDELRHTLQRGDALQKQIKSHPCIRLYLHGHTHRQTVANLQPNNLPILLDSGSCTHRTQGSWNLIEISGQKCAVTRYRFCNEWTPVLSEEFSWT